MVLTEEQGKLLVRLARNTLDRHIGGEGADQNEELKAPFLGEPRGAFVTLKEGGQLRGCIGYVSPIKPLYLAVRDVARFAALEDSRFRPVGAAELPSLEYEISVLSPMRRVLDTKEIVIGRHGLLLRKGGNEGVFLPQVPVEEKWDRATELEDLYSKVGFPPPSWQDRAADLFRCGAVGFGEEKRS